MYKTWKLLPGASRRVPVHQMSHHKHVDVMFVFFKSVLEYLAFRETCIPRVWVITAQTDISFNFILC